MSRRAAGSLGAVVGVLLLGTACGGGYSEPKLYTELYEQACKKAFECDEAGASSEWGDRGACESAYEGEADAAMAYYAACDYQPKPAKDYVKSLKGLGCEPSEAELDQLDALWRQVYTCPQQGTTPPPTETTETGDTGFAPTWI